MNENKEYKELKLPEEMTKKERIDLLLSSSSTKTEGETVNSLIYDIIGLIGYFLFVILFGGGGIIAILQDEPNATLKIIGSIFVLASIYIAYRDVLFAIDIKRHISKKRK